MSEHDYFEAWWKKQELGDKANYEADRAFRTVALSAWLARSALTPLPEAATPERRLLTKDAQIGSTIFRPGVYWETVIARAEREYEYVKRYGENDRAVGRWVHADTIEEAEYVGQDGSMWRYRPQAQRFTTWGENDTDGEVAPLSAIVPKEGDTPRTDAWFKENGGECYRFSKMDAVAFARELERELADALALAEQNAQIAEAMGKRAVVSATALPVAAKELLENALGALTACDGKDDCCGEVDHGRHTWPLKFEIRDRIKDYLNGLDRTSA